jgi:hypothetical protein
MGKLIVGGPIFVTIRGGVAKLVAFPPTDPKVRGSNLNAFLLVNADLKPDTFRTIFFLAYPRIIIYHFSVHN